MRKTELCCLLQEGITKTGKNRARIGRWCYMVAALTALVAGLLVGTAAVAPFLKFPVLTGFGVFLEN